MQLDFTLSMKPTVVIRTIHQPHSGLCLVFVASICSCLLYLPCHNIPTVTDTTFLVPCLCFTLLLNILTWNPKADFSSFSEITDEKIPFCVQPIEWYNWRLMDVSSDGTTLVSKQLLLTFLSSSVVEK